MIGLLEVILEDDTMALAALVVGAAYGLSHYFGISFSLADIVPGL